MCAFYALFAIVIVGTVLGRRYRVGPPVLLIGLGALLGLIPQFGHVRLDGEIVLLLFLPAILYWESLNASFDPIPGPLAYSRFPHEIVTFSERFVKTRVENLTYYGEPTAGGHFAAFEQPELFVGEFTAAIGSLPD